MKMGDKVLCRFYNTPEGKFYGDYWEGTIVAVLSGESKPGLVSRMGLPGLPEMRLHRKEIRRILKK